MDPSIRTAEPADYDVVAPLIDSWWGRPILGSLPRLFLDLFHRTSLVIDGTGRTRVRAITAPMNVTSVDFHRSMGFAVTGPVTGYNGPAHDMLVFDRGL